MAHLRNISRSPSPAQQGTSIVETAIIFLLTIFFQDWDNYPTVVQNLQKYFSKTPTDGVL